MPHPLRHAAVGPSEPDHPPVHDGPFARSKTGCATPGAGARAGDIDRNSHGLRGCGLAWREAEGDDAAAASCARPSLASTSAKREEHAGFDVSGPVRHSERRQLSKVSLRSEGRQLSKVSVLSLLTEDSSSRHDAKRDLAIGSMIDSTFDLVEGAQSSVRGSILRSDVEETLETTEPATLDWLTTTVGGLLFQYGLCGFMVFNSLYETVFKSKAIQNSEAAGHAIDPASIPINSAIVSLVIVFITATARKEWNLLINDSTLRRLKLFAIPSALFSLDLYLQMIILALIPADVFKALEQSRLLTTALLSRSVMGTTQTKSEWNGLLLTCLAAIGFSLTKKQEKASSSNSETDDGGAAVMYAISIPLTFVVVWTQSGAYLLSEKFCKDDMHLPFYIQKFFIDAWSLIFGLIMSTALNPLMLLLVEVLEDTSGVELRSRMAALEGNYFKTPTRGWDNFWSFLLLVFVTSKLWCQGILVKKFSSIVKFLCSVVAMGLTYFAGKLHICDGDGFFCWHQLSTITLEMVLADAILMQSVVSYALSKTAKTPSA